MFLKENKIYHIKHAFDEREKKIKGTEISEFPMTFLKIVCEADNMSSVSTQDDIQERPEQVMCPKKRKGGGWEKNCFLQVKNGKKL